MQLRLAPADDRVTVEDDCIVFTAPAAAYQLRVTATEPPALGQRGPIVFDTCNPRLEATPAQFESNTVEATPMGP
jgi:hypothetical protein